MLVILIAMLPLVIYTLFRPASGEQLYLPNWLTYIILGAVTLIWALIISGFDAFSAVNKK